MSPGQVLVDLSDLKILSNGVHYFHLTHTRIFWASVYFQICAGGAIAKNSGALSVILPHSLLDQAGKLCSAMFGHWEMDQNQLSPH